MSDWKLTQTEHINQAERTKFGQYVELYLDNDGLQVSAESGGQYNRSSEAVLVPLALLLQMLRHAGHEVNGNEDGS